jgi:hypothetical protein
MGGSQRQKASFQNDCLWLLEKPKSKREIHRAGRLAANVITLRSPVVAP